MRAPRWLAALLALGACADPPATTDDRPTDGTSLDRPRDTAAPDDLAGDLPGDRVDAGLDVAEDIAPDAALPDAALPDAPSDGVYVRPPAITVPPRRPAPDLSTYPFPRSDAGRPILVRVRELQLEVDLARRDAVTAHGACVDLITYCVAPPARSLEGISHPTAVRPGPPRSASALRRLPSARRIRPIPFTPWDTH